jgi:hypothetical protein
MKYCLAVMFSTSGSDVRHKIKDQLNEGGRHCIDFVVRLIGLRKLVSFVWHGSSVLAV